MSCANLRRLPRLWLVLALLAAIFPLARHATAIEVYGYGGVNLAIPLYEDDITFGINGGVRLGEREAVLITRYRVGGQLVSTVKDIVDSRVGFFLGLGYSMSGEEEGAFAQTSIGYNVTPNLAILGSVNYNLDNGSVYPGISTVGTSTVYYKGRTEVGCHRFSLPDYLRITCIGAD